MCLCVFDRIACDSNHHPVNLHVSVCFLSVLLYTSRYHYVLHPHMIKAIATSHFTILDHKAPLTVLLQEHPRRDHVQIDTLSEHKPPTPNRRQNS